MARKGEMMAKTKKETKEGFYDRMSQLPFIRVSNRRLPDNIFFLELNCRPKKALFVFF